MGKEVNTEMAKIQFQNPDSASGKQDDWIDLCPQFAKDEMFQSFRSHPTMLRVVEGTPIIAGKWNLRRLKTSPLFNRFADKFSKSDKVGSPKELVCFNLHGRSIAMSPTTIRYVNNLMNLVELFNLDILLREIVEIGGGYGGECKIVNDFSSEYFQNKIGVKWNIFDLESSAPLIRKWLNEFGYKVAFNPDPVSLRDPALVISNAAFSEMNRELQEKYFNEIILTAENGYFIENFSIFSASFGGFTREEFKKRLRFAGKHVYDLDARLWLSNFDKDAETGLIVFSTKKIDIPRRYLSLKNREEILTNKIFRLFRINL